MNDVYTLMSTLDADPTEPEESSEGFDPWIATTMHLSLAINYNSQGTQYGIVIIDLSLVRQKRKSQCTNIGVLLMMDN